MLQAIKKNKNNIINYEKIIIFDLDDTLVNSNIKVPKQTYHILNNFKKKNIYLSVITYNIFPLIV